jgi:hypothetical protein
MLAPDRRTKLIKHNREILPQEARNSMATKQTETTDSEEQIITRAQSAVSQCNWVVGECAAAWTEKYAKGRTDADFAALVGLSADQVYQRRRVAETFGDVRETYSSLKWSHFYVALKWDDSPECLQWAEENEATVAEMKAWRRALKGEDLTTEAEFDDWSGDPGVAFVPTEASPVLDPDSFDGSGEGGSRGSAADSPELVSAVARDADGGTGGGDYSPYRQGAASPPPKESGGVTAVVEKPLLSAEQMLKRAVTTLERINKALTEEMLQEIKKQPQKKRDRLVKVVGEISSKTAKLM